MTTTLSRPRAAHGHAVPPASSRAATAPPAEGRWHTAVVVSAALPSLRLSVDGHERDALQALGCLVELQTGDEVAAFVQGERCWVTALLERPVAQPLRIGSPHGLSLRGPHVTVEADESLRLQAPQVHLGCEQAQFTGQQLHLVAAGIKAVGSALSTVFDRVQHFSKQHQRTTEGLDRTQAQHMELQAEQLLQVRSEHTLIDGEKLVKARGAQIHFG